MKQTLLITLFSFVFSSFIIASNDTFTDKMAAIGSPGLSSDPCVAIDKKLIRLDTFTTMVHNTSSFHLEEKAEALSVPGITVSNNKKKMLRDAKRKYTEYSSEYKKYGCGTPMTLSTDEEAVVSETSAAMDKQTVKQDKVNNSSTNTFTDKIAVIGSPSLSSDPCAAIDKKLIRLEKFTTMVNNTSSFHLEEKSEALAVPGITVSNNKKKMSRDAKKKFSQYSAERQKYSCDTPMIVSTDKNTIESKQALPSEPSAVVYTKPVKQDKVTAKAKNTNIVHEVEKAKVLTVPKVTATNNKVQMQKVEKKKPETTEVEPPKYASETPAPVSTAKTVETKQEINEPILSTTSSDACAAIDKKRIKLYEFMIMVNNTSSFHLEEKAEALAVPGITVSNNKKKMLRDAKKKHAKLLEERQKYGCETPEN